jgi:hypothetical protein
VFAGLDDIVRRKTDVLPNVLSPGEAGHDVIGWTSKDGAKLYFLPAVLHSLMRDRARRHGHPWRLSVRTFPAAMVTVGIVEPCGASNVHRVKFGGRTTRVLAVKAEMPGAAPAIPKPGGMLKLVNLLNRLS